MKKLLYCLAVVMSGVAALTGCTTFDDEHSEHYGEGPAVTITLSETKDNSFTFTVAPAEGTNYYAYTVVKGDEAQDVSENAVLKKTLGGVSEAIVKYSDVAVTTVDMLNAKQEGICSPNTSYVIYAVAANDKGVTGKVQSLVVKTTDGEAPTLQPYTAKNPTGDDDVITNIQFSENVYQGDGTVSAAYFQEWGDGSLIAIPAQDVHVAIDGSNVSLSADNVPAGAYVLYSWTEGAFVDSFGNKCPAENSTIGDEGFVGVWRRMPTKAFSITTDMITPEVGSTIGQYDEWTGTITFPFDVYRNDITESDDCVKLGDVSVTYQNSRKTTDVALDIDDWAVKGKTLTFKLPEAPAVGDYVTVKIKEGVVMDINGNGNTAFTLTSSAWKYAGFIATKDMVLGNFNISYYSQRSKADGNNAVSIVEAPAGNEDEADIYIEGLFSADAEVGGNLDLDNNKMYIGVGYPVAVSGSNYILTYSASQANTIECSINSDGTITSTDLAFVVYDPAGKTIKGWYDIWPTAKFAKITSAAKAKARTRAAIGTKSLKKVNLKGLKAPARKVIKK